MAKPGILADRAFQLPDACGFGGRYDRVSLGPAAFVIGDDEVVVEAKWVETRLQKGLSAHALVLLRAAFFAPASRGDRRTASAIHREQAVGHGEVLQLVGIFLNHDGCEDSRTERGDMVDHYIVKWRAARQHDQENAAAFVILFVEIVSDDVVNAVDAAIGGNALTLGGMRIRDLEDATDVADPVVPKRNVIDAADRTVARLAARAQQHREASLTETTPGIF